MSEREYRRGVRAKTPLIWIVLGLLALAPVVIAAMSPLHSSRDVTYSAAGLAGVAGLALLLIQPLLSVGLLPGVRLPMSRKSHRWIGSAIAAFVLIHIGGLYLTSPPDTIDALTLASPTPFSVYGVIAMWGLLLTIFLFALRRTLGLNVGLWRTIHTVLALAIVGSTVAHAMMIDGTMGYMSKLILCVAVVVSSLTAVAYVRVIKPAKRSRQTASR